MMPSCQGSCVHILETQYTDSKREKAEHIPPTNLKPKSIQYAIIVPVEIMAACSRYEHVQHLRENPRVEALTSMKTAKPRE